ncbi:MAG: major coat protein [Oscillospiraceae bacterium]
MMYAMMAEGVTSFIDSVDFSGITDMATSVAGKAVPVIVGVLVITIGVKLVKKFGNKIG